MNEIMRCVGKAAARNAEPVRRLASWLLDREERGDLTDYEADLLDHALAMVALWEMG